MATGVIRGEFALSVFDEIYGSSAVFIHPLVWSRNEPFRYERLIAGKQHLQGVAKRSEL